MTRQALEKLQDMPSIGTVCNEYRLNPLDLDTKTITEASRLFN